jgi:hypothetical protein
MAVTRLGVATLAAASLATQGYWIATGDPFGLGLVPAFHPAGAGNLPVFAVVAGLAVTAAWTMTLAAAVRARGEPGFRAWGLSAVTLALLSLQRLALPSPRLGDDRAWLDVGYVPPPALRARDILLAVVAAGCVGAVALVWRHAGAGRRRLLGAATAFAAGSAIHAVAGAASVAALDDPRLAPALLSIGARVLELTGVALAFDAVSRRLREVAPEIELGSTPEVSRAVAAHPIRSGLEIRVHPRRIAWLLGTAIAGLVTASALSAWAYASWPQVHRAYRLFYVDFEGNLPTWWSAVILLACGGLAALLGSQAGSARRDWRWLAFLFVAMATDEAASLHELLQPPLRAALDSPRWLRYPLILPGMVVAAVLVLRFHRFAASLGATGRRLGWGALVFAAGALGLETVGGWFAPEAIGPNATYSLVVTLEEACEMTGAAMVLVALLGHAITTPSGHRRHQIIYTGSELVLPAVSR